MDNLLPCPFCGGEATISDGGYSGEKFLARCREMSCPAASGFIRKTHDEAIAAWNHRAQPENMPLTLDELRQMDGEPVWVMHQDGSGARWGIVKDTEHGLCVVVDDDTAYWFTDVCGTIAYRTKPKEVEHEALEMV